MREQVSYFEKSRDYMVRMIGENGTKEMLKKSMFTITIGSNDILNYIQPSIPFFSQDKLPIGVLQDSMVFHLTTHLKVVKDSTLCRYIMHEVSSNYYGIIVFCYHLRPLVNS